MIAKMRHERFGASSERGRKLLDQLELQLEEMEAAATEDEAAVQASPRPEGTRMPPTRRKPIRAPFPAHLPRERVVVPGPAACPCCQGKLSKLGEDVTETLEVVPRQFKVIQTVRERMACRACEAIHQPPAPFHVIPRGRAGPELLATILEAKSGQHLPLNRQSETFAREGIELDVSTLADWVGACSAALSPLVALIRAHVLAAERIHGDDTTVPVLAPSHSASRRGSLAPSHSASRMGSLAKTSTTTGRLWTYVRDDRPSMVLLRLRPCSTTRATAAASTRPGTWPATAASSRPTPTPGSKYLEDWDPKEIDELPLRIALGRIANRRNAARTRINKSTTRSWTAADRPTSAAAFTGWMR